VLGAALLALLPGPGGLLDVSCHCVSKGFGLDHEIDVESDRSNETQLQDCEVADMSSESGHVQQKMIQTVGYSHSDHSWAASLYAMWAGSCIVLADVVS
jgi:hypothetical protein